MVLAEAPRLTTGQLAARLRRLTVTLDPEDSRHRYERGVEERRVVGEANPDGTANLLAFNLPPETVVAALERVNRLAKEANTSGDERSIDQIRADVFCDLVTGRGLSAAPPGRWTSPSTWPPSPDSRRCPGRSRGGDRSSPTSPAKSPSPTSVASGGSPSPTRTAGRWCGTGPPEDDPQQPNAATSRRGNRCVSSPGAGCPPGTATSTTPRTTPKADATHPHNLGPLCRHHHRLKHEAGWKLEQPTPGTFTWTSPLGHTYHSPDRAP